MARGVGCTAVIVSCRSTDTATAGLVIRQQIRQRAQAAREARRVALTRGYRKGELPDIEQLTVSDFAEPLRAARLTQGRLHCL